MEKRIRRNARIYSTEAVTEEGLAVVANRLNEFYAGLNMVPLCQLTSLPYGTKHGLHVNIFEMEMDNPVIDTPEYQAGAPSHDTFIKRAPALFYYLGEQAVEYSKSSAIILGMLHVRTEPLENHPEWVEQEVRDETGWTEPVYLAGPETTILY